MFQPFYNGHHQCVDDNKVKTMSRENCCYDRTSHDKPITKRKSWLEATFLSGSYATNQYPCSLMVQVSHK